MIESISSEFETESLTTQQEPFRPYPDYIKTIFLHLFEKRPYKKDDSFPGYFCYEYGIINISMYFDELKNEGLICPSTPQEILSIKRIHDLKEILSQNNLKITGKKDDLITRILDQINSSEIPTLNETYFSLSLKGKEFINNHSDYIKLKQHPKWHIGFWEYQNAKEDQNETNDFESIILSILETKILNIKKERSNLSQFDYFTLYDLYRSTYHLLSDKENYVEALKSILKCALLSLSGCRNNWLINYKKTTKASNQKVMKNYFPTEIEPYVAKSICDLQKYCSEKLLSDVYFEFIGPYNLCTFRMFYEIINLIFNSSTLDISKYDKIIRDLFIKKLK